MEQPRKRGRPPGSKNKPKHNNIIPTNGNNGTAFIDSDEDTSVGAPQYNSEHHRWSKTARRKPYKKRKQISDDDGDVLDESQAERRPAKRSRQTNGSSDEEEHVSGDDPSAEEQSDVDSDVEDIEDEDSNPGSVSDLGDNLSSPDDTSSYQPQDSDHISLDLTEEEKRVLIPPKKAIVRSKADWEYEAQLPGTLIDRDDVDDNYKDAVAFNDDWTKEDERQL
jgi:hypothetical protein